MLEKDGFTIVCEPLIKIIPTPFQLPQAHFDWVFFSSAECVINFFEQLNAPLSNKLKFGVIGVGTAKTLASYKVKANFTGVDIDTNKVANSFVEQLAENEIVLFPIGNKSNKTVQIQLNTSQQLDVEVYHTNNVTFKSQQAFDAIIFSSPSNVNSYLKENKLTANCKIFTFGQLTSNLLANKGFTSQAFPSLDEETIVSEVLFYFK